MTRHCQRISRSLTRCRPLLVVLGALAIACGETATTTSVPQRLTVDVDYYTLANGLKVVLSRDTTVPTAGVGV